MKTSNFLSLNIILSFFGIYLSDFYFGTYVYFYAEYNLIEILKSALSISLLFSIPIILILFFFKKKENLFTKIIISSIIGILIYILFHYLIRFSDINYYYIYLRFIDNESFLIKIIFYFFPFIIAFLISFTLKNEQMFKVNKFILILLIILNITSLYRIINIYKFSEGKNYEKFDFKNFVKSENNSQIIKKKVFILLFDEFEQILFEKNLEKFDQIKMLYDSSYVNKNFYSPAQYTLDSIPAILTGSPTTQTILKGGELYVKDLNNEMIHFNHNNSLFNLKNYTSSIYATYHPYCRILKVKKCYDQFYSEKKKIDFIKGINNFFNITYLSRIFNPLSNLENIDLDQIRKDINFSKFMINNSLEFLKSNTDIIYIHYPFPHLPLKEGIIELKSENQNLSDYEKNLFLINHTFSKINNYINKQENSLLIVTSDHWYRDKSENLALPIVFFAKIIGDNNYYEEISPKNSTNIKELVTLFFGNFILSNQDISNFFKNKKNHKTYTR